MTGLICCWLTDIVTVMGQGDVHIKHGLGDAELSTRSMLTAIVNQPTRGTNRAPGQNLCE